MNTYGKRDPKFLAPRCVPRIAAFGVFTPTVAPPLGAQLFTEFRRVIGVSGGRVVRPSETVFRDWFELDQRI